MFSSMYYKSLLSSNYNYVGNTTIHFCSLLNNASPLIVIRSCSSAVAVDSSKKHEDKQQKHSFTVSYLINTCGLSSESAAFVSKTVNFTSPEQPDSVLRLLRDYGFSSTHISKLVKKSPALLVSSPEKTLLPKLEYLQTIGVSRSDLPKIICWNPILLTRRLQKLIVPYIDLLKSFTSSDGVDAKFVQILKRSSWISLRTQHNIAVTNVSILKEHGVSQSTILRLVTYYPDLLFLKEDNLREHVKKVIEMGFNPSMATFVHALLAFAQMSKSTWEHKTEVYRKWGLSNNEIHLAFKKHPQFMRASEEKITSLMEFLVNKMGWQPSAVARCPTVLCYSLEKRIIPRCSVIRVLLLKGLIKGEIPLSSVLTSTQMIFLDRYVNKYREQVPELLSIFQGKMDLPELGIGFEQTSSANLFSM